MMTEGAFEQRVKDLDNSSVIHSEDAKLDRAFALFTGLASAVFTGAGIVTGIEKDILVTGANGIASISLGAVSNVYFSKAHLQRDLVVEDYAARQNLENLAISQGIITPEVVKVDK